METEKKFIETENGEKMEITCYDPPASEEIDSVIETIKARHRAALMATADLTDEEFLKKRKGIENALKRMDSDFLITSEDLVYANKILRKVLKERDALLDKYARLRDLHKDDGR